MILPTAHPEIRPTMIHHTTVILPPVQARAAALHFSLKLDGGCYLRVCRATTMPCGARAPGQWRVWYPVLTLAWAWRRGAQGSLLNARATCHGRFPPPIRAPQCRV